MKAVRIHEFGGLDVLNWEDAPDPEPRPHQVLIKVDAAGVNYADLIDGAATTPAPTCRRRWALRQRERWRRSAPRSPGCPWASG